MKGQRITARSCGLGRLEGIGLVVAELPRPGRVRSGGVVALGDCVLTVYPENTIKEFEDIKSIEDLQRVSREAVWQNFERLTAFIFQENDFHVEINTVKTSNKKRRQYDVIARKRDKTFLIECKKWAGNRRRLSALKWAVKQHKERTEFYRTLTNENVIPVVVTFIEEEISFCEEVPVVPIMKLNSFINEEDRGETRMQIRTSSS